MLNGHFERSEQLTCFYELGFIHKLKRLPFGTPNAPFVSFSHDLSYHSLKPSSNSNRIIQTEQLALETNSKYRAVGVDERSMGGCSGRAIIQTPCSSNPAFSELNLRYLLCLWLFSDGGRGSDGSFSTAALCTYINFPHNLFNKQRPETNFHNRSPIQMSEFMSSFCRTFAHAGYCVSLCHHYAHHITCTCLSKGCRLR